MITFQSFRATEHQMLTSDCSYPLLILSEQSGELVYVLDLASLERVA